MVSVSTPSIRKSSLNLQEIGSGIEWIWRQIKRIEELILN